MWQEPRDVNATREAAWIIMLRFSRIIWEKYKIQKKYEKGIYKDLKYRRQNYKMYEI